VRAPVLAMLLAMLLAAGCGRTDPQPTRSSEAAPMAVAPALVSDAAPVVAAPLIDAAPPPDCAALGRGLAGLVGRAMHAANGAVHLSRATQMWQTTPPACRDAGWHLAAAHLLRWGASELAAADGTRFDDAPSALAAGLNSAAPDRDLLVMIAFTSALGADPLLPADACASVTAAPPALGPAYESADRAAYVCGHAALRAGEYARAAEHFAAIEMATRYPDLALRQVVANACAGKTAVARKFARPARSLEPLRAEIFGAIPSEHAALVADAKSRDIRAGRCPK
jgi:hypothetical protein